MRREPGQDKRDTFPFFYRKLRDGGQIFSARFNRRPQNESVRSGDRFESIVRLSHPGNDEPVFKTNNQFHLHAHFAAQSFHDANEVGIFAARRHEIDEPHRAACRFNLRLDDQRVATIAPTRLVDLVGRRKRPVALFFLTE